MRSVLPPFQSCEAAFRYARWPLLVCTVCLASATVRLSSTEPINVQKPSMNHVVGARHHVPGTAVGGLVLAAVTSLPNAVAAVYLAQRGRGAATLSTAMNSNVLNVTLGFLLPSALIGIGSASASATLVAGAYLGVTLLALARAYAGRGLRDGAVIIVAYLAFVSALLAVA